MSKGELFVVSAPSGAGKTTLCKMICQSVPGVAYSVSYTTRPPRPGEEHGRDYHFVSDEQFQGMIERGEFLEWAEVYQWRYGTSRLWVKEAMDRSLDVLLDIDVQGARKVRQQALPAHFIFILPPSFEELRSRLSKRATETPEQIEVRLNRALEELHEWRSYDYLIVNEDLTVAGDELASIIKAKRCRRERRSHWVEENRDRWRGKSR